MGSLPLRNFSTKMEGFKVTVCKRALRVDNS